jgi:hypothetical protein
MNNSPFTHPNHIPIELADKQVANDELAKAISDSSELLAKATTVFPFTIFPDTITIDRAKVTITHREFFKVGEVMSMRIEDILNVTAHVGPLFGSIQISTRFFDQHKPYAVNYFWREDALKIKRILQGYIIAIQNEIDCSALSTRELSAKLDELGASARNENL